MKKSVSAICFWMISVSFLGFFVTFLSVILGLVLGQGWDFLNAGVGTLGMTMCVIFFGLRNEISLSRDEIVGQKKKEEDEKTG